MRTGKCSLVNGLCSNVAVYSEMKFIDAGVLAHDCTCAVIFSAGCLLDGYTDVAAAKILAIRFALLLAHDLGQ